MSVVTEAIVPAADFTGQRVAVTILTVLAFMLAAGGLFHAFLSTDRAARRTDTERQQRAAFQALLEVDGLEEMSSAEADAAIEAAEARWYAAHVAAGLEPAGTLATIGTGREFIAERLVRELRDSTRVDIGIVGTGLALGLIASIWGTWIP